MQKQVALKLHITVHIFTYTHTFFKKSNMQNILMCYEVKGECWKRQL